MACNGLRQILTLPSACMQVRSGAAGCAGAAGQCGGVGRQPRAGHGESSHEARLPAAVNSPAPFEQYFVLPITFHLHIMLLPCCGEGPTCMPAGPLLAYPRETRLLQLHGWAGGECRGDTACKVERWPAACRGAKPILREGAKFPAFSLHLAPSLQPLELLTGPSAAKELAAALKEYPPNAAPAFAQVSS